MGDLPLQCAATCDVTINVQRMVVEAALTGDKDLVKLAMMHDPLTGAVLNPPEIYHLADAMFDALAEWMPQFNGEGRTWQRPSAAQWGTHPPHHTKRVIGGRRIWRKAFQWLSPAVYRCAGVFVTIYTL